MLRSETAKVSQNILHQLLGESANIDPFFSQGILHLFLITFGINFHCRCKFFSFFFHRVYWTLWELSVNSAFLTTAWENDRSFDVIPKITMNWNYFWSSYLIFSKRGKRYHENALKFIYSEKAKKFEKIFYLNLKVT